jgi:hypothetical protein
MNDRRFLRRSRAAYLAGKEECLKAEGRQIERLIQKGYLRDIAFQRTPYKVRQQGGKWPTRTQRTGIYPLTKKGEELASTYGYSRFRDSPPIRIVRDVFTVLAFFGSLYLILERIFAG